MSRLDTLQHGIQERQEELHRIADILATQAERKAKSAGWARATTIILGAFAATQAIAVRLFGEQNAGVLVAYAVAGLVIAAVGALESTFKLDARGAELRVLAAQCQSTLWQIDAEWSKTVGTSTGDEQLAAARMLLDRQNQSLADIQARSAQAGVNIAFAVRELYVEHDHRPAMA
jgi:hypothetical protein